MKHCIRKNCFETNSSSMHSIVVTKSDNIVTEDMMVEDYTFSYDYNAKKDENGKYPEVIDLTYDEMDFGRSPFEILTSVKEKIRYAIASLCRPINNIETADEDYQYNLDIVKKIEDIIKEVYPKFTRIKLSRYIEYGEHFWYACTQYQYVDENGNKIHPTFVDLDSNSDTNDESNSQFYIIKNDVKVPVYRTDDLCEFLEFGSIDHQSKGLLQSFLDKNNVTLKEFLLNKKYYVVIDGDEYCIFDKLKKENIINTENIEKEFEYTDILDRYNPEYAEYD